MAEEQDDLLMFLDEELTYSSCASDESDETKVRKTVMFNLTWLLQPF